LVDVAAFEAHDLEHAEHRALVEQVVEQLGLADGKEFPLHLHLLEPLQL